SVALVYPSLHEGFGIPPLEAMACRTLAITSNTTSLPEVMGDGGIMLDPTREADWVECLLKIAKGGGERDVMIERGLERVRMFSWKKTVEQHLEVYSCLESLRGFVSACGLFSRVPIKIDRLLGETI